MNIYFFRFGVRVNMKSRYNENKYILIMITNDSDLSFLLKHFILHFIKLLYMARYYGRDVFVFKKTMM